eukprot:3612469-Pleurochrysis_carterae.AAC.1
MATSISVLILPFQCTRFVRPYASFGVYLPRTRHRRISSHCKAYHIGGYKGMWAIHVVVTESRSNTLPDTEFLRKKGKQIWRRQLGRDVQATAQICYVQQKAAADAGLLTVAKYAP